MEFYKNSSSIEDENSSNVASIEEEIEDTNENNYELCYEDSSDDELIEVSLNDDGLIKVSVSDSSLPSDNIKEESKNENNDDFQWHYIHNGAGKPIQVWKSDTLQQSEPEGVVLFLHDISQENANRKSENELQNNFVRLDLS